MEETETLVIDIGEKIKEANDKADLEIKQSAVTMTIFIGILKTLLSIYEPNIGGDKNA